MINKFSDSKIVAAYSLICMYAIQTYLFLVDYVSYRPIICVGGRKCIFRVTHETFNSALDLAARLKSLSGGLLFPCPCPKLAA